MGKMPSILLDSVSFNEQNDSFSNTRSGVRDVVGQSRHFTSKIDPT